jgi:polar amino acid transport system substrate-binding protein
MKTLAALLLGCACFVAATRAADLPLSMPILDARPYGWVDGQGKPQGLYPDIAAALARETGLQIDVEIVPFARAASLVASNAADATLMFNTAISGGRAVEAVVVFYANQVMQMRPGVTVADRNGLRPLALGRMNGGCQELAADTSVPWRFQELNSQESGLRMLLAGRIDAFCTASETLQDTVTTSGLEGDFLNAQRLVLAAKPVWLMLARRVPPEMRQKLAAAVQRLQKNGELARIFRARLGTGYVLNSPK